VTFGADDRKDILKKSRKQEKRSADTYRGSRNIGSGNGWLRKNDVRAEQFLIENKLTIGNKSITIKAVDLKELRERAILEDRVPVLQFDLNGRHYVVLVEDDFLSLIPNE
jgi:hypothetical protein